ncbi:MAG: DALR anticodon-binding domain-containing protein, partial [Alphaproteobacteria bacterium]
DDAANLLTAYRRASNIVRIEEKKDKTGYAEPPAEDAFSQNEETALHASLTATMSASSALLENEDFNGAMSELAKLRGPVDAFFDKVTVNSEDPVLRINRLKQLSQIRSKLHEIADFSQIEGGER